MSFLANIFSGVGDFLGDTIGGITGAKQAGQAAERAGQTQAASAQQGIDEQRRQFDALIQLMSPYVGAGNTAIGQQQAMLGLQGTGAQQGAIDAISNSPLLQQLMQQGENAMLQNASATGGLRGGNIQGALAQFRPSMLQQAIEQQYSRLGGLSQMGQASAAGQAAQGMSMASNIGNLYGNQGAAIAGGQLGLGNVGRQTFGDALNVGSAMAKAFGGGSSAKI